MTATRIPFIFPLPNGGSVSQSSSLSVIRAWATSKVHAHARRLGCRVQGDPYAWDFTAEEDGRPAVACMAVLVSLPTIADEVARIRRRGAAERALAEGRCLTCEAIEDYRVQGWGDDEIAEALEMAGPSGPGRHMAVCPAERLAIKLARQALDRGRPVDAGRIAEQTGLDERRTRTVIARARTEHRSAFHRRDA